MKKLSLFIILGAMLLNPLFVFAEKCAVMEGERAVNVNIGSMGGGIDSALSLARNAIGSAFIKGIVDTLYVYSPRIGSPIPIEGGLALCAEAGFIIDSENPDDLIKFCDFVDQLRAINPLGGFNTVTLTKACKPINANGSVENK